MKPVSRICVLFFMALLLLPDGIRIAHVLADHEHFVCENYSENHFHKVDLDCELCDFQKASFPLVKLFEGEPYIAQKEHSKVKSTYYFLEQYQALSFALRGPPTIS